MSKSLVRLTPFLPTLLCTINKEVIINRECVFHYRDKTLLWSVERKVLDMELKAIMI